MLTLIDRFTIQRKIITRFVNISVVIISLFTGTHGAQAVEPKNIHDIMVYEFESDFETAREDLVQIIKSRGLVISYTSHAKTMLDRTASAVGIKDSMYSTGAQIILFCKASTSHKLVQANPHYIALCPYAISIYDVQGANGKVFLSYRKPPNGVKEYEAIEDLLKSLIEEVIEG